MISIKFPTTKILLTIQTKIVKEQLNSANYNFNLKYQKTLNRNKICRKWKVIYFNPPLTDISQKIGKKILKLINYHFDISRLKYSLSIHINVKNKKNYKKLIFTIFTTRYVRSSECLDDWKDAWLDIALWHVLFSSILLVIMVLWRPNINNQIYAYSPMIDGSDSDLEEENEAMLGSGLFLFNKYKLN